MGDKNETIVALRALAATSVMLHHFSGMHTQVSALKPLGFYGWLGVEIFFVISGFILPYAMYRANYRLAYAPSFMLKRLARLWPPFAVALAVALAVSFAAALVPSFRGQWPDYDVSQIASNVTYLATINGVRWIYNPDWTLAIEMQFYLVIAASLPLLAHNKKTIRIASLCTLAAVSFLEPVASPNRWNTPFILPFLPIFLEGILAFWYRSRLISTVELWLLVALMAIVTTATNGTASALASTSTALIIAYVSLPKLPIISGLGAISYSIYLVHLIVGPRILNLLSRVPELGEASRIAAAVSVSLAVSAVFYFAIERPSQMLSSRLRYTQSLKLTRVPVAVPAE